MLMSSTPLCLRKALKCPCGIVKLYKSCVLCVIIKSVYIKVSNKLNGMCLPEENLLGLLLQMVSNVQFRAKYILGWLEVCWFVFFNELVCY